MAPFDRHLVFLLAICTALCCLALTAHAQDTSRDRAPSGANAPAVLTGKERLGRKWADEQRIDNCNVPIDKRGTRPRPSSCYNAPSW
jgi:hypothetical protein